MVAVDAGDEEIDVAVVVVVGGGAAHAVHRHRQARRLRALDEPAGAVVLVERRQARRRLARPVPAVRQEQILIAVTVGVEDHHAAAHRLGQVLLAEGAVGVAEADAGGGRDVGEGDRRRTGLGGGAWLRPHRRHEGCRGRNRQESREHADGRSSRRRLAAGIGRRERHAAVPAEFFHAGLGREVGLGDGALDAVEGVPRRVAVRLRWTSS